MLEQILALDTLLHLKVLALNLSPAWLFFFAVISLSIYFIYPALMAYYGLSKKQKKSRWKAIILMLGTVILYSVIEILKVFTHRIRPDGSDDFSFPSRHTAFAVFLLFALPWSRKEKFILLAWAILVSASRIFLDVHYLSDVIVGAVIGTICGLALKHEELKKHLVKHF